MALSPLTAPSLTNFRALSFDIFGTVIDEPQSLLTALNSLISLLPADHPAKTSPTAPLAAFAKHEATIQAHNPSQAFEDVLSTTYHAVAAEWNVQANDSDAQAVFHHLCTSPPFPDTIPALKTLSQHYKLIALSNNSSAGLAAVKSGPLKEIKFDAVLSAGAIGPYKPDMRNFEYLLKTAKEEMGVEKEQLLHVAQGVASDHGPAKQMGMWSARISRDRPAEEGGYAGVGEENEGMVTYQWRWHSLGDMARDVEAAFRGES